mgnify:CR=1 FL=1
MGYINEICTYTPKNKVEREELANFSEAWLPDSHELQEKLLRIAASTGVKTRYFAISPLQISQLKGLQQRAETFTKLGTEILLKNLNELLEKSGINPKDIGVFISTSCSLPSIPSIDVNVIDKLELPRTIPRLPIFQHGCSGGVFGIGLAEKLSRSLQKPVLLSSLELCSLVFQPNSHEDVQLVAASLFADGAASLFISNEPGKLEILDSMSYLIEESSHLMGYDITDGGFHLLLDRRLPDLLLKKAPQVVEKFLERHNSNVKDIECWLFHPGSKKILDNLSSCFKLEFNQCRWSYQVLENFGNMSSATIIYVLKEFLNDPLRPGGNVLVMGIGPGLTIELLLCRK